MKGLLVNRSTKLKMNSASFFAVSAFMMIIARSLLRDDTDCLDEGGHFAEKIISGNGQQPDETKWYRYDHSFSPFCVTDVNMMDSLDWLHSALPLLAGMFL